MKKIILLSLILIISISPLVLAEGMEIIEIENDIEDVEEEAVDEEDETLEIVEIEEDVEDEREVEEISIDEITDEFDDFDISEARRTVRGIRAVYGPIISFASFDMSQLNNELSDLNLDKFSDDMLLFGRGGTVGLRNGSRFGTLNLSGQERIKSSDGKEAIMAVEYGGLIYEQAIYAANQTDLSLGFLLGRGSKNLTIRHSSEEDIEFANGPYGEIYEKTFFALEPRLNLNYKVASLISIDLTGSYLWTYNRDGKWDVLGVETTDNTGDLSGPAISARLSIGF